MRAYILSLCLAALFATGCTNTFQNKRNGITVYESSHFTAPFYSSHTISQNTQKYPRALAEYGPMPNGEEVVLATQKVYAQHTRDVNNILYGGYGVWGAYGMGYSPARFRAMQYLQSTPVYYTAPPMMPVPSNY